MIAIAQIAAQFKNGSKNKNAIAENLERLEWFGILLFHQEGQIKHWQHNRDPASELNMAERDYLKPDLLLTEHLC